MVSNVETPIQVSVPSDCLNDMQAAWKTQILFHNQLEEIEAMPSTVEGLCPLHEWES